MSAISDAIDRVYQERKELRAEVELLRAENERLETLLGYAEDHISELIDRLHALEALEPQR